MDENVPPSPVAREDVGEVVPPRRDFKIFGAPARPDKDPLRDIFFYPPSSKRGVNSFSFVIKELLTPIVSDGALRVGTQCLTQPGAPEK